VIAGVICTRTTMSDEDHRRVIYSAFATFATHTSVLPLADRLYFYELLALDLTVGIRTSGLMCI
jgi:hypothetical protein